ncbi:ABC transporter substrate-binding protein [Natronosporangium hydrolyticum]|uniref:ABC transporter substrate-binding protein n=1 Tax=Natronosporangium hydrolyticum TaxID=2811111 RepID=A0A895YFA9_9ACTN|nr:ABC transporter substrate-binding protein [Natronosporangium hydrolyticum]QSB16271.1 ABC transporter substrate-binding protein [Natronosporangium hydrolyticum]
MVTRNRFRARLAAPAVAALAALLAGCALSSGGSPPAIVVGADLALTGPGAAVGEVYRRGIELRVEQLNRQRPAGASPVELRVLDNRTEPATTAANLAELAADPAVTAVVSGGCTACVAATETGWDEAGVPVVALAPGEQVAGPDGAGRFVFQLAPPTSAAADLLAAELAQAPAETVGLLTLAAPGDGADGARELSQALAGAGLDLVVHEEVTGYPDSDGGDGPAASAATRVAQWRPVDPPGFFPGDPAAVDPSTGPDAVVLWAPPAPAATLASMLREAGWAGELYLPPLAAGPVSLPAATREAFGDARLVFTETLVIDEVIATSPARTARQLWWREYVAAYGGYDAHASFAADALDVVVAAVDRIDQTGREAVRETIMSTNLDGLSGPIRFTPQNHSGLQPLALRVLVVSGDRWRLAS